MAGCSVIVKEDNILGEGPCYDSIWGRIWWFDILSRHIFWASPDGSSHGRFELPARASVAAPVADGTLLIASEDGLFQLDRASGATVKVLDRPDWPAGFRSNDGKADMGGNLWWSSMDDNGGERPGVIHRYRAGRNTTVLDGVHIANSMAFSVDNRTLFLSDSKLRTIFVHDLDSRGRVLKRREFAKLTDGEPDGAAIDAEGHLWVAVWDGWRLERYTPDGSTKRVIELPVQRPTSCIFGGPDLSTLFITTARVGLTERELSRQPLAGSLLAIHPDVKGVPIPPLAA
jgi:sugar lactone lactonase YvrE